MTKILVEDLGVVRENNPGSADGRIIPQTEFQNSQIIVTTGSNDDLAMEERTGRTLYTRTVKKEQQAKYLKNLIKFKVGTNRIESNQVKSIEEELVGYPLSTRTSTSGSLSCKGK